MSIFAHPEGGALLQDMAGLLILVLLATAAIGVRAWFATDRLTAWPPRPDIPAAEIQDIAE